MIAEVDEPMDKNHARRVLHLSYTGMLEPLGRSQVLIYLSRLSDEYAFTLVSFEKPADLADNDAVGEFARGMRAIRHKLAATSLPPLPPHAGNDLGSVRPALASVSAFVPARDPLGPLPQQHPGYRGLAVRQAAPKAVHLRHACSVARRDCDGWTLGSRVFDISDTEMGRATPVARCCMGKFPRGGRRAYHVVEGRDRQFCGLFMHQQILVDVPKNESLRSST